MPALLLEADPQAQKAFAKKIDELLASMDKLEGDAVKRVYALLNDARERIVLSVAQTEWQAHRLGELKRAVDEALRDFAARYGAEMKDWQEKGWDLGVLTVDEPLAAVGIHAPIAALSRTALEVLQGYSADLIQGLTDDARKRITGEIALGLLGEKTPFDVIKAIGKNLDDPSAFRTIFHRAEAIARTELNRVSSVATQGRLKQAAAAGVDVKKRWLHRHLAKYPRPAHVAADGQLRDIDKPFVMGNGAKLMYPHDPGAPARETVMCK